MTTPGSREVSPSLSRALILLCSALSLFACSKEQDDETPADQPTIYSEEPSIRIQAPTPDASGQNAPVTVRALGKVLIYRNLDGKASTSDLLASLSSPLRSEKELTPDAPATLFAEVRPKNGGLSLGDLFLNAPNVTIQSPYIRVETPAMKGPLIGPGRLHLYTVSTGEGETVRAVLETPIESYLTGVLSKSALAEFPREALCALAIACRTQAVYSMVEARQTERFFDALPTAYDQPYSAPCDIEAFVLAVQGTRGVIMTDGENRAFRALYHNTCGGATANLNDVFGSDDPAHMIFTPKKCPYCLDSSAFSWKVPAPDARIRETLAELDQATGQIDRPFKLQSVIERIEPAPMPDNTTIRPTHFLFYVKGQSDPFRAHALSFCMLYLSLIEAYNAKQTTESERLKPIYSAAFTATQDPAAKRWILEGHGKGAGVGLCILGARGLALGLGGDDLLFADEILKYYYTGIQLQKAWK